MVGHDPRAAWWRVRSQFGVRTFIFFTKSTATEPAANNLWTFRELGQDDALIHNGKPNAGGAAKLPLDRFAAGHRCFALVDRQDDVASWGWVSGGGDRRIDVPWEGTLHLQVGARTGYIWDCRTVPAFRGRGLYRDLLMRISRVLLEKGAERVMIYCNQNNEPSRRGILAAGFDMVMSMRLVRIGPVYLLLGMRSGISMAWTGAAVSPAGTG